MRVHPQTIQSCDIFLLSFLFSDFFFSFFFFVCPLLFYSHYFYAKIRRRERRNDLRLFESVFKGTVLRVTHTQLNGLNLKLGRHFQVMCKAYWRPLAATRSFLFKQKFSAKICSVEVVRKEVSTRTVSGMDSAKYN